LFIGLEELEQRTLVVVTDYSNNPSFDKKDDGLPRRMDRAKRLKALGNAVVPQIVEIIGRAIIQIEQAGV